MSSLSDRLRELTAEVQRLEVELQGQETKDHETVYRYYYGKGALDFRDKLIAVLGGLKVNYSAVDAYNTFLSTFPDPYPGPAK